MPRFEIGDNPLLSDSPAVWHGLIEDAGPASLLVAIESRMGAALRRRLAQRGRPSSARASNHDQGLPVPAPAQATDDPRRPASGGPRTARLAGNGDISALAENPRHSAPLPGEHSSSYLQRARLWDIARQMEVHDMTLWNRIVHQYPRWVKVLQSAGVVLIGIDGGIGLDWTRSQLAHPTCCRGNGACSGEPGGVGDPENRGVHRARRPQGRQPQRRRRDRHPRLRHLHRPVHQCQQSRY